MMLTFRRGLVAAAIIISFLLFLRLKHTSDRPQPLAQHNSPKPTGSYLDNKKLQETPPGGSTSIDVASSIPSTSARGSGGCVSANTKLLTKIPLKDLKGLPLRRQLSYAFPYDLEAKFPAFIWQTWKYTPSASDFDEPLRLAEASWTELHPSFVHEVITDDIAGHLIKHFFASVPEVVKAYFALPQPVLKADFFRYLILLARVGIYSDIDTTALKSAIEWVPTGFPQSTYGLVIGIAADPDRPDWQDWYSRRIQFCQWTIQSKPGHPVLVDIVAAITEETLKRVTAGELDNKNRKSAVEFTGPVIWTDIIFRYFNNAEYFDMSTSEGNITWQQFTGIKEARKVGDVVILPITSFSPGVGSMGAGREYDAMAFVKHTFEAT